MQEAAARQGLIGASTDPTQGPRQMLWGLVQDRASLYCFTAELGTEPCATPASEDCLEP